MQTVKSADGTVIAYDTHGTDGPAVILVGGAFQHRAFDPNTTRTARLLADGRRVVHYDRRGRGDSTDTAPYSPARELEDIAALIDALGGSAALFGHSSGAVLALDATAAGLPVTRVAVYEAPLIVNDCRPPVGPDYLARIQALADADRRDETVELFLTEGVGLPAALVAQLRRMPTWRGFTGVAHTLPYDITIVNGLLDGAPPPVTRWSGIAVPALVMDGGASGPQMSTAADFIASVVAAAQRRTLPGQDHGPHPDVLAPVLAEFF